MPTKQKSQLRKRTESFLWRLGSMVLISLLTFVGDPETLKAMNEAGIVIPAIVLGIAGLIFGEITKFLNKKGEDPVRGT